MQWTNKLALGEPGSEGEDVILLMSAAFVNNQSHLGGLILNAEQVYFADMQMKSLTLVQKLLATYPDPVRF